MKNILRLTTGAAVTLIGVACADFGSAPSADVAGSIAAFESVPAGFSATSSSFDAAGDLGAPFQPHRGDGSVEDKRRHERGSGKDGREGPGRPFLFGFLMGGGIDRHFLGEIGFGPGKGRGPFRVDSVGSSCVFSSSTGLVTCGPITRAGLTITATAQITTVDGTAQARIDSTTDKVRMTTEVTGTKTRRDSVTSEVAHQSTRTIGGLAAASTRRTVDGTSVGTEKTTGMSDMGAFTAIRTVNDTTAGIVVPLTEGRPTYPMAGRVSRNMSVAVTVDGTTTTHTRSEVVTYDGSATATVVITQDGRTKHCTIALPKGRLVCN